MKKLMMIIGAVMFSVSIYSESIAIGCTICTTSSEECHRVIVIGGDGKTVTHIHYGIESSCDPIE